MRYSLGLVIIGAVGWFAFPEHLGRVGAMATSGVGQHKILTFGLAPAWLDDYRRAMWDRYGVEVRAVAGCVVSDELRRFTGAWNETSTKMIERQLGRDVVAGTMNEFYEEWKRKRCEQKW